MFTSVWFTPRYQPGAWWPIIYLVLMTSLFYSAFTLWNIPYSGLGLELETDYEERTKLMIFRVAPSFIVGILIGALYKLTLMKDVWHGDEVIGARYVCSIVAVLDADHRHHPGHFFPGTIRPAHSPREAQHVAVHGPDVQGPVLPAPDGTPRSLCSSDCSSCSPCSPMSPFTIRARETNNSWPRSACGPARCRQRPSS